MTDLAKPENFRISSLCDNTEILIGKKLKSVDKILSNALKIVSCTDGLYYRLKKVEAASYTKKDNTVLLNITANLVDRKKEIKSCWISLLFEQALDKGFDIIFEFEGEPKIAKVCRDTSEEIIENKREYVSTITLEDEKLEKAENVLEMALVTLEAYNGPHYIILQVNKALRKCLYLYEINAHLIDSNDVTKECNITILYEPWMKANSIAQACFEFNDDPTYTSLVIKRNKNVKYYKNNELLHTDSSKSLIPYPQTLIP